MKKLFFTLAIVFIAMTSYGQLKVVAPNGDVGIGTATPTEKLEVAGTILMEDGSVIKTGSSASIMFDRQDESAFIIGAGNEAGMSWDQDYDYELRSNLRSKITVNRFIQNGPLRFFIDGTTGNAAFGSSTPGVRLFVNGSLSYNGTLSNGSDMRLKKNVTDFDLGLEELLQLEPIRYQYNGKANTNPDEKHIGLYAQALQKVAPELVGEFTYVPEDEEGREGATETYLNIKESAIKYMIVNAIQEQQEIIDAQDAQIEALEEKINALAALIENRPDAIDNDPSSTRASQAIELTGNGAFVKQNNPNPFNGATNIDYFIPDNAGTAVIEFVDETGRIIKTEAITSNGAGTLNISTDMLSPGVITYNLKVNGEIVSTKKMVLTR